MKVIWQCFASASSSLLDDCRPLTHYQPPSTQQADDIRNYFGRQGCTGPSTTLNGKRLIDDSKELYVSGGTKQSFVTHNLPFYDRRLPHVQGEQRLRYTVVEASQTHITTFPLLVR